MRAVFLGLSLAAGLAGSLTGQASAEQRPAPPAGHTVFTSVYDLSPLPTFSGTVAQYLPDPYGGISGLLLTDGTEILFAPDIGSAVSGLAKPGSRITGRGLKARSAPVIRAFSLTGSGRSVEDDGFQRSLPGLDQTPGPDISVQSVVAHPLYDLHGSVTGVILKDQTVVHIRSEDISRLSDWLRPGQVIHVAGTGHSSALGVALNAREIGPEGGKSVQITPEGSVPPGPAAGSPGYDVILGNLSK
ncbi:hypothetical protein LOC54_04565 [Acetobacter sp. AN02]|uniref:hypothetical protein n=1 Tax=Acetobacter sp. AN02 TaxID=2894186 RepID=UPI0024340C70|nr:hypothetical protein [Acetobacter sp. AN02]MDG6094391.1 hypothetical protein [Acetobacter sp. AN02]